MVFGAVRADRQQEAQTQPVGSREKNHLEMIQFNIHSFLLIEVVSGAAHVRGHARVCEKAQMLSSFKSCLQSCGTGASDGGPLDSITRTNPSAL